MERNLAGIVFIIAIVAVTCIAVTLLSIILAWANEFRRNK